MTELEEFRKQKDVFSRKLRCFFAQTAKRVHILVRIAGLAETLLRYLTRRIEENPRIVLRTKTEIVALEGAEDVERVRWRDQMGNIEARDISHVFLMTGRDSSYSPGRARLEEFYQDRMIWWPHAGRFRGLRIF